ncbi:MAG: hypothetical protein JWQ81_3492 [Amycolatopsis sp.]|uniref:hypothetical protein n=1 Tax=Amycolatopsis sp. TaxID=37632 RepID=UPI00261BDDF8|nr:hypothetical protein [Amycolatopsis sp.]MCU1682753.1 hypothetical protein [Amycolatopsis sp.]
MFEVLFIIAAVGFVLIRRMMGEQAEAKRMLVLPAILTVIGLGNSGDVLHSPMALVFLLVTGAVRQPNQLVQGQGRRAAHHGAVVELGTSCPATRIEVLMDARRTSRIGARPRFPSRLYPTRSHLSAECRLLLSVADSQGAVSAVARPSER